MGSPLTVVNFTGRCIPARFLSCHRSFSPPRESCHCPSSLHPRNGLYRTQPLSFINDEIFELKFNTAEAPDCGFISSCRTFCPTPRSRSAEQSGRPCGHTYGIRVWKSLSINDRISFSLSVSPALMADLQE